MTGRIRIPIRIKFMLTFLILVTAVVGLITFSTANLFQEDKKAYINGLTSMVALGAAEEARSALTGYRDRLRLYGMLILDEETSADRFDAYTRTLFDEVPELVSIEIFPDEGDPASAFNTSQLQMAGQSRGELEAFLQANPVPLDVISLGTPYVRNNVFDPELPCFTMAFYLEPGEGQEVGGLVSAVVLTDRLQQLTTRFSAYEQFLTDSEGHVLAHSDPEAVARNERPFLPEETAQVRDEFSASLTLEYDLNETPTIGGFASVEFGDVLAAAQIPRSAAHLASKQVVSRLLVVSLILLFLAIVTGFLWAHNITRPMESLTQATRKIAGGAFDSRIEIRSSDEMGDLAGSFNQMAGELKERERKLHETHAQLVQSEKLAAIGQLGAGIAHEVKNPLAGIMSCAQLALDDAEEGSDLAEDLKMIEQETRRCKKIIDNLLQFSRPDESRMMPIDPIQVLETTVAIVNHQMHINQVNVKKELPESAPPIYGDPNQLQQVFMNLMINAQQAMAGQPGTIHLSTDLSREGRIALYFRDTGPGIPEDVQEKLFEPFFTTKPAGEGTGLGLSVSYGIIKDHKGEIVVESEVGEGTTFVLDFPLSTEAIPDEMLQTGEIVTG